MNAAVTLKVLLSVFALTFHLAHGEPHQHQEPHVHGVSKIKLTADHTNIWIQLDSPANNIVGFERIATSLKEKKRINNAKLILSNPERLFDFQGSHCSKQSDTVNFNGLLESHNHQTHNTHTEITAQYHFTCDSIKELSYISIQIFNKFPNILEINAQWISDTGQGMTTITKDNNQLIIK